jgi:hypothetical protein
MRGSFAFLLLVALAGVRGLPRPGQAGPIPWSYQTTWNSIVLSPDDGGETSVSFSGVGWTPALGSSSVLIGQTTPSWLDLGGRDAHSSDVTFGPPGNDFQLTLEIKDSASQQTGSVTVSGRVLGTLHYSEFDTLDPPQAFSNLQAVLDGTSPPSLHLGSNTYTFSGLAVDFGGYPDNNLLSPPAVGSDFLTVTVTPDTRPAAAPEPSGLTLAALGLPLLGLLARRRRQRGRTAGAQPAR